MAIKKPITKTPLKSAKPAAAPLKSKKRPRRVEEDGSEETDDEPDEEEETPKQRRARLRREAEEAAAEESGDDDGDESDDSDDDSDGDGDEADESDDDDDEPPRRKGSAKKAKFKTSKVKKRSFADIFDSTKPGRGLFPAGDWKAKVLGFELQGEIAGEDEDQEELKVKVTYEGHEDEDEVAGKKISQWYSLVTEDGEAGPGIQYLKGDLDILGYEDVTLADLEEIFGDVESEQPDVIIKVKENKGYTNAYLQGLADGE